MKPDYLLLLSIFTSPFCLFESSNNKITVLLIGQCILPSFDLACFAIPNF